MQCTYALCASPWPLNQHMWISRRGTCFWDGRSCMCNQVWKVRIMLKEFKNVSAFSNCTGPKDMVISQDGYALYLLASLGAATLSCTHRSRCGPHSVVAAFTLCLLRFHIRVLALFSSLPSQLLPFCRRDNHCKNKVVTLPKHLVTTVAWLSLPCKFYECNAGNWEIMRW